jgi:hypothetical protein
MNGRIAAEIQGLEMDIYYLKNEIKNHRKTIRDDEKELIKLRKC